MVANFTASPIKTMRLRKLNKLFEVMEIRGVKVFAHWFVPPIGGSDLAWRSGVTIAGDHRSSCILRRYSDSRVRL